MMHYKLLLFGLTTLILNVRVCGQDYLMCGTQIPHSKKHNELKAYKFSNHSNQNSNSRKADFSGTKFRFKVKAHAFRKLATSANSIDLTNISEDQIETHIHNLNRAFDLVNFEFVLCKVNYINVSDHNLTFKINSDKTADETKYCDPNDSPGYINIYFASEVTMDERRIGGRADFPEYDRLFNMPKGIRLIVDKSSSQTLIHEMGHFFNLYHTSETIQGREKADGSNCSSTGDLLCDTPADPYPSGSSLYFDNSCNYTGPMNDPWGTAYAPLTNNYMSLNPLNCRRSFSNDQIYRMHNYGLVDRNDLLIPYESAFDYNIRNNKFYPPFAEVPVNTVASSILTSSSVITESSDINYYADEKIVLKKGFSVKKGSKFRAKKIDFCDMPQRKSGVILLNPRRMAEIEEVHEPGNLDELLEKEQVKVFPNPNNGIGTISYNCKESSMANVTIYDMYGKKIHSISNVQMNEGDNSLKLELPDCPSGIYSAIIETELGFFSEQFVISK